MKHLRPHVHCPSPVAATASLGAPASRAALEHVAVMQNAVQHGGDSGYIAQQLAPVFNWDLHRFPGDEAGSRT